MNTRMTFSMLPAVMFVLLAGVGLSLAQAESPELFIHEASRIQAVPEINGRLDDECWQTARKWDGFMASAGKKAEIKTSFAALYDGQYFYLGIECEDPDTAGLVARYEGRDSKVYEDDSVEIFFDPAHSHENEYQLVVNSKGEKYDGCKKIGKKWDPDWDVKTSVTSGAWTVELRIPFAAFDQGPQDRKAFGAAVWGFALCRNRHTAGDFGRSYFGAIYGSHHQPKLFGHLVFREFMAKACLAEKEKVAAALGRNHEVAKKLQGVFEENSGKIDQLARMLSRPGAELNACYREYEAILEQYASILKQFNELEWDARFEPLFQKK